MNKPIIQQIIFEQGVPYYSVRLDSGECVRYYGFADTPEEAYQKYRDRMMTKEFIRRETELTIMLGLL